MKIVFFGTPDFAVASLDILIKNNYEVVAVVTAPDKPAGRGQQIQQSAVKQYAIAYDLNILQPEKLKDEQFITTLKKLNADLFIIVAFRMLPEIIWSMPPKGTFNLHGSLLPQYRGAAPINWAVINGEKQTGVTTFFLQHEIDTGKILFNETTDISDSDTAGEVYDRLMNIGAKLVLKTVRAIESGDYKETEQRQFYKTESELRHAPKIFKDDCKINWTKDVWSIHNHIRGLSPYPTAFTELVAPNGASQNLKIFRSEPQLVADITSLPKPGTLVSDNKKSLKVACANGYIYLLELQLAGKKRMGTEEFLRGFKLDGLFLVR